MLVPSNLTLAFFDHARSFAHQIALIEPTAWTAEGITEERTWTFGEFSELIQAHQQRLDQEGFRPGEHILILLPVSVQLYALVAACFANGLVPVFIETTIARDQFLKAIRQAQPAGIFSTQQLFKYRFLLPVLWGRKLYSFDQKGVLVKHWADLKPSGETNPLRERMPGDQALITFTTGSTGEPKAADRRVDLLYYQREISKQLWTTDQDDDIELTAFPLVVLNNLVHGVTTVLPVLNADRLDQLPMKCWLQQLHQHKITRLVSPPSIMSQLTKTHENHRAAFWNLRKSITGGAATPNWLLKRIQNLLPDSENQIVYGSTEAEPISHVDVNEALAADETQGYLVGQPIKQIALSLQKESNEVMVAGPHVVQRYLFGSTADRQAKVTDHNGRIWHCTGDAGRLDSRGRLFLRGRLSDRVNGMDVYPLEHAVENLLETRAALVDDPKLGATLWIQNAIATDVAKAEELCKHLGHACQIRSLGALPMDRRHFWKIDRRKLRNTGSR